jgi:hypothetical protein
MPKTFKDRLCILMNGERPYTWAKKIGIENMLFQYYWQKGKIPTYANLLKIQEYTGCSLDWLLTGKSVEFDKIDKPLLLKSGNKKNDARNLGLSRTVAKLKKIYSKKSEEDIKVLEYITDAILNTRK